MSPSRALIANGVHRIRQRARNGQTYAVHATLTDGQQIRQPVPNRYRSAGAVVQSGGAFRMEPVR
jgi:hypothetical protein